MQTTWYYYSTGDDVFALTHVWSGSVIDVVGMVGEAPQAGGWDVAGVAAAIGLAQTEKYEYFVDTRESIGLAMRDVVLDCEFMIPQKKIDGSRNTYWTFASRFTHEDVGWQEFRKKFMENGGESIYGCWALTYNEPMVSEGEYKYHNPQK